MAVMSDGSGGQRECYNCPVQGCKYVAAAKDGNTSLVYTDVGQLDILAPIQTLGDGKGFDCKLNPGCPIARYATSTDGTMEMLKRVENLHMMAQANELFLE